MVTNLHPVFMYIILLYCSQVDPDPRPPTTVYFNQIKWFGRKKCGFGSGWLAGWLVGTLYSFLHALHIKEMRFHANVNNTSMYACKKRVWRELVSCCRQSQQSLQTICNISHDVGLHLACLLVLILYLHYHFDD